MITNNDTAREKPSDAAATSAASQLEATLVRLRQLADGAIATVEVGREKVARLTVRERDGSSRFSRPLTQFFPSRRWISTHPLNMSGLSFTADGRFLYLSYADADETADSPSRVVTAYAVRADGSLAKGARQRKLLEAEGVPFRGERVDMRVARIP